jgi:hypothetical protein
VQKLPGVDTLPEGDSEALIRIVSFLTEIGIAVHFETLDAQPLLPGVDIRNGSLIVDVAKLVWPGDLLHEAGHIAVMPAALRGLMSGELSDGPTAPHAGEVEATAWAYAAIVAIGLPPEILFHEGGYQGQSQGLIFTYSCGVYPGAVGLAHAGLTVVKHSATGHEQTMIYPRMLKWLRD